MDTFKPFENDTQSTTIGPDEGLTFENGTESISIYGDFQITKDTSGEDIDKLIEILNDIKNSLNPNKTSKLSK